MQLCNSFKSEAWLCSTEIRPRQHHQIPLKCSCFLELQRSWSEKHFGSDVDSVHSFLGSLSIDALFRLGVLQRSVSDVAAVLRTHRPHWQWRQLERGPSQLMNLSLCLWKLGNMEICWRSWHVCARVQDAAPLSCTWMLIRWAKQRRGDPYR